MPSWIRTVVVFGGWLVALLACIAVLVYGFVRAAGDKQGRTNGHENVNVELPEHKIALSFRISTGIFLVLAGLIGTVFVCIQYPKVLLALPILAGGGGAVERKKRVRERRQNARRQRHRGQRSARSDKGGRARNS